MVAEFVLGHRRWRRLGWGRGWGSGRRQRKWTERIVGRGGCGLTVGGSWLLLEEVEAMEAVNADCARLALVAGPGGGRVMLVVAVG